MSDWGTHEAGVKGGKARAAIHIQREPYTPEWLNMVPIKRYKYFTLYAKRSRRGDIYYECFQNSEIDQYKKGHKHG